MHGELEDHVSALTTDINKHYNESTIAFKTAADEAGNITPLTITLNPYSVFKKTDISPLSEDQIKILSELSKTIYPNLGLLDTAKINPEILARQMRENALRLGSKKFDIDYSNFLESRIFEPYLQKAYASNTDAARDMVLKLKNGEMAKGEDKYERMIKFLIKEPLTENSIANEFIPMNIPVEVLLDIKKQLRSNSFNATSRLNEISSSGQISAATEISKLRTSLESMERDINIIDGVIEGTVESITDNVLKANYLKALEKNKEAKAFFKKHNNHYKGGEVRISIDNKLIDIDATGSPLHRINNLLSKYGRNDEPFENYLLEFVSPKNGEHRLAKYQFDMLARKKDGEYDIEIVEQMVRSLGLIIEDSKSLKQNILENFTVWFDDVIENVSEHPQWISSERGKKLKYHYSNWKNLQRTHIKTIEISSAVEYTARESEIAKTLISYFNKIDNETGNIFKDSTLSKIIQKTETLGIAKISDLLFEKVSTREFEEIIDRFPKLKQILDEKNFYTDLRKELLPESPIHKLPIDETARAEMERVAGEFKETHITRLDVLMHEASLAVGKKIITEEKYSDIVDFVKKAMMEKLYNSAVTKTPQARLIDGVEDAGDFVSFQKEFMDSVKGTDKTIGGREFVDWLREVKASIQKN